jgi:flagellar basal-body rod protein FlgF
MNPALLTAAAGMKARIETVDVLSNNLANASTAGFKGDAEFYRLFQSARARPDPRTGDDDPMPVAEASWVNLAQGPIETTGSAFDIALEGPGFLAVEGPNGTLYTRQGSLGRSAAGELVGPNGLRVPGEDGKPIQIPPNVAITISADGTIRANEATLGRLPIVEFDEPRLLRKAGDALFSAPEQAKPRPAAETTVRQGAVEGSNVSASLAAVRLISANRHFEMLRRAASLIGEEMDGRAISELGRVS